MTGHHVTAEDLQRRVQDVHGGIVLLIENTYVNMGTKAEFIDVDHGSWWTKPGNVIHRRSRHPARSGNIERCRANSLVLASRPAEERRHTDVDEVKERLVSTHGGSLRLDDTYVNMGTKARFIDSEFGECWLDPHSVLTKNKQHPDRAKRDKRIKLTTPITTIEARVYEKHGDVVVLDSSTYAGVNSNARFIDVEHGEWWAIPSNVMRGTSHPKRAAKKIMAASFGAASISHWLTGELCVARGSYERATLAWLNTNQYDYDWQIPITTPILTPKGKQSIYYVDLLIKSGQFANTYVEIKGTWNRKNGHIGKAKWEWFHDAHPNSQLWMKVELLERGIIT